MYKLCYITTSCIACEQAHNWERTSEDWAGAAQSTPRSPAGRIIFAAISARAFPIVSLLAG